MNENKFFDFYSAIYKKQKIQIEFKDWHWCITLNKWLGFDKDNVQSIKKLLPYMFYVEPKHYYYLLFFNIRKKYNVPFHKKIVKVKEKDDKLRDKICYILGWSKRVYDLQKPILDKVINSNKSYWKKELGVS